VNTNVSICMSVAARVGISMCVSICVHISTNTGNAIPSYSYHY